MTEGQIDRPLSRRKLLQILLGSTLVAGLVVLGAILPAEFHRDPLGIGKATGLLGLSAPAEVQLDAKQIASGSAAAHFYPSAFRSDEVEIPIAAGGDVKRGDELEWKVRMKAGDTLVYSWSVEAPEEEFYSDFHSQSDPAPEVQVVSYKEGVGASSHGAMTAPFAGIHGWYLQNQSVKPVVVHLKLSGFYEMRPDPYAPE